MDSTREYFSAFWAGERAVGAGVRRQLGLRRRGCSSAVFGGDVAGTAPPLAPLELQTHRERSAGGPRRTSAAASLAEISAGCYPGKNVHMALARGETFRCTIFRCIFSLCTNAQPWLTLHP